MNDPLLVDCLQASRPSRERFLEWREGDVGCVHVTLAICENARETLQTPLPVGEGFGVREGQISAHRQGESSTSAPHPRPLSWRERGECRQTPRSWTA